MFGHPDSGVELDAQHGVVGSINGLEDRSAATRRRQCLPRPGRSRHADAFVAEQVSVAAWSRGLDVASEIDRIGGSGFRLDTAADREAENDCLRSLMAKAK